MITYDEALAIIEKESKTVASETVYVTDIVGRVLAEDILSPMDIQQFNNSAMDGFALNANDIQNASEQNNVSLKCLGKIAAGEAVPNIPTKQGECWEIMTGAIMPDDCDSVVPVENITVDGENIIYKASCAKNAHLRFKGEDFKKNDTVLTAGTILTSEHILVLATLGVNKLTVRKRVKIAVVSTGKEVINDLKQPLETGQIYNSTGPYIISALTEAGADVKFYGTLPDKEDAFEPLIQKIVTEDVHIIISTGAVSAGKHDFIKPALLNMNAEILFHKVFIRPGKPNLFAKLPSGTIFFGLPGNPVATVAGLRFFVTPLMRSLLGLELEKPIKATLTNDCNTKEGFRFFLKAKMDQDLDGSVKATILKGQKSFMVNPFTKANAWAISTENQTTLKAGDEINVYPLTTKKTIFNTQENI